MNIIVFMGDTGRDNQYLFLCNRKFRWNSLLHKKPYRAGSHCGGMEDVARSDPPQAENPAKRILFCCLKMEKRSSVG